MAGQVGKKICLKVRGGDAEQPTLVINVTYVKRGVTKLKDK